MDYVSKVGSTKGIVNLQSIFVSTSELFLGRTVNTGGPFELRVCRRPCCHGSVCSSYYHTNGICRMALPSLTECSCVYLQDVDIIYAYMHGMESLCSLREAALRGICKSVRYEFHDANDILYW